MTSPTLETELELVSSHGLVVCLDEVGRGAIAGPVVVAATVFRADSIREIPPGLRDSKLIAESKRATVASLAADWLDHSVGEVPASKIDEIGITQALKQAGLSAIEKLGNPQGAILLDGKHNWLETDAAMTKIKADQHCAGVSAASIIAKHYRDQLMRDLHQLHPEYAWDSNKGYASEGHISAIREHGSTEIHRKTWLTRIINSDQTLF